MGIGTLIALWLLLTFWVIKDQGGLRGTPPNFHWALNETDPHRRFLLLLICCVYILHSLISALTI